MSSQENNNETSEVIRIAAAVIGNRHGKMLLVRKRGTSFFMQAGGKIEQGEEPLAALERELGEELGFTFDRADCRFLGKFTAPAANEEHASVEADVFYIKSDTSVGPQAEIEQAIWIDPRNMGSMKVAPLTRQVLVLNFDDSKPIGQPVGSS
ncbi:NUDIX hydrolase [Kiloniella litopenaei]|uniref:NUDIX hydrolase n=1 Tax=Kiloniella litopenaei TaxID=1549748 RepID=UPI003BAA09C1